MQTNRVRNWEQHDHVQTSVEREKQIFIRKRKVGWVTKGEKALYTIVSVVALCAIYYIISFSSTTYSVNKDLQNLQQKIDQKIVMNDSLVFEVKELSKPERIIKIAKENGFKAQNTQVKQATK